MKLRQIFENEQLQDIEYQIQTAKFKLNHVQHNMDAVLNAMGVRDDSGQEQSATILPKTPQGRELQAKYSELVNHKKALTSQIDGLYAQYRQLKGTPNP
jgi:prefoldin subunit 5